ncbi:hypothetical protein QYE76_062186 [Lolium multiflorum]|uniref:RNase H type-1 domain-containing protein n=1 Tax=Lolium multiflorum TaxID=4521 RepID=A0AAD8S3L8_LOLMU|nr:hypothetical protein QYE76_062186 [Lolium multiflorum]
MSYGAGSTYSGGKLVTDTLTLGPNDVSVLSGFIFGCSLDTEYHNSDAGIMGFGAVWFSFFVQVSRLVGPREKKKWFPPEVGQFKINVDGGISRHGDKGAVAAVCRDETGKYIGASAVVYQGQNDPASLEAIACNEALSLALDLQLTKIKIASDCLEVIINLNNKVPCRYVMVLKEIEYRSSLFQVASFSHEFRESNGDAHSLVKAVVSLPAGRYTWLLGTPEITYIPVN